MVWAKKVTLADVLSEKGYATGASPSVHGMIANVWYDANSGELGYNIEDAKAPLLATRDSSTGGAQIDPAQQRARSSGRSPRAILAPTFSDTLKIATAGKTSPPKLQTNWQRNPALAAPFPAVAFDRGPVAAMHGSPWSYDSHVPIIFAGAGIDAARVNRLVHPVDVAPTLSALSNLSAPAAQGTVLVEVVKESP